MADIAILVAEEYERRTRAPRKVAESAGATTTKVAVSGGSTAALAEKLRGLNWVNKVDQAFKDLEPKSQLGLAAFSGFFSA